MKHVVCTQARRVTVHTRAQPCPEKVHGGTGRVGRSLAPRSFVGRPRRYAAIDGAYSYVGSLMIFVLQSEVAYGTRLAVLAGYGGYVVDLVPLANVFTTRVVRCSTVVSVPRATAIMIVGRCASVCGYGEVCAFAPRGSGPRVFIAKNIITVVAKHFRCAEVLSQQRNYEFPYGHNITVSVKRLRRAEVLFQPSFQPA